MNDNYIRKYYIWKGPENPPGKHIYIFTRGKSYCTDKYGLITSDKGDKVNPKVYPKMVPAEDVYYFDEFGQNIQVCPKVKNSSPGKEADRHNDGKPEMSYILQGPKGLAGLAQVLEFGSRKYDRGNWLKGFPDTSLIDSMMRHLTAYISGEVLDPESGLPHIDHIHANAKFLAEHGERDEK
jgi:hypothetical protein